MAQYNSRHYRELFLNDMPLMDMRAPIEFSQRALMLDDERAVLMGTLTG